MGIELPAELQDVAARTGAKWPEADEDKMRESASAWRDAAKSIEALTSAADGTAQGALGAFDGEAAQAARRDWDKLAADDGVLPSSAKQCRAAADRLDHAAEQVGAAKVQLVRELVTLAKQTDAAEQAAAAGHPQALAALDSALNGAAANVAQVHNTLTSAVDRDSGVLVEPHGSQGPLSAAGGALSAASSTVDAAVTHGAGAVSGAAGAVDETAHGAADGVGRVANETADGFGRVADETVGGVAEGVGRAAHDTVGDVGGAVEGVGRSAHETVGGVAAGAHGAAEEVARTAQPWQGDAEHTGPVKVDPGGWAPGLADASTGPIPMIGDSARSGWTPEGGDPASSTAPHAVHSAWASPQAPQPPLPGAAAPPQGFAPAAPGGHFVAQPGVPGAPSVSAAPPPAAAARPPMPSVAPRGPIAFGSPGPQGPQAPQPQAPQPQAHKPQAHKLQAPQPQAHQRMQRAPLRPLPAPSQPLAPVVPDAPQRPLRQGSRNADVVAFVLHQFPIGYMPVAASKASRQLPVPEAVEEDRSGLSFPPQDHPQSHLVDDSDALERTRSAEVYAAAQRDRAERSEPEQLPAELTEGHEPLGELSEPEWERRFLARAGERSEYAWPPAAEFPEGGVEPAEPVVLAPDVVLDCLGSGDGRILFAAATPFAQRSLPAAYDERDYRRYRVMRPLPVWQAVAAPWFAQPGGGMRYRATYSLIDLVGLGYLVELTKAREVAEAATLRIAREDVSDGIAGSVASAVRLTRDEAEAATSDEDRKTGNPAVASTERLTREDVEVKAAEAGVASALRIARDEADGGPATTDGGTAQEAAK
ncbi:TNT domain-containing protein [Saccharopolyspora spinosa]|uniref:TNT domain-containing protein n=1 Tax=Saccharopolyspora spinosa TaxID=60894 RepID=UPI0002379347|nr:TNT domain-containing protein [Saccharopolyspora spinosa]